MQILHFRFDFQFNDLLIKPVQRIQKYHLLVRDVLRHSERAGCSSQALCALRQAACITSQIPEAANDMMDVGRLQGFDVRLNHQSSNPITTSDGCFI